MTQEYLNSIFQYKDGKLFWKVKPAKQLKAGIEAGTNMNMGYTSISIKKRLYLRHRLIWIMFKGEIPDGYNIDHIDRDRSNDRIENLRLATQMQNTWNVPVSKNNKCGFKGVSFSKGKNKWIAQIGANGVKKHLGYYDTPELASEAYNQKSKELHGEFSNSNKSICE